MSFSLSWDSHMKNFNREKQNGAMKSIGIIPWECRGKNNQLRNRKDFPREMVFEHPRRSGTFSFGKLGAIHLGKTTLPILLALRKSRVKKWMDSSIIFPSAFVWSCKSPSWLSRHGTFSALPLAPRLCRQTITHGHVDGSASLRLQPDYLPSLDRESSPEWASSCLWVTQSHGYLIIFLYPLGTLLRILKCVRYGASLQAKYLYLPKYRIDRHEEKKYL